MQKQPDEFEAIYDYQNSKFYFDNLALVEYCEGKDFQEHNNFIYKQLIQYLKQDNNGTIVISDTLGTELIPDSSIIFASHMGDTSLRRWRDQKSPYAYVTEAMNQAVIDFAARGKLRVYDKMEQQFAAFIVIDKVDKKWYGETNIHLPNDSVVFSQLRWIK